MSGDSLPPPLPPPITEEPPSRPQPVTKPASTHTASSGPSLGNLVSPQTAAFLPPVPPTTMPTMIPSVSTPCQLQVRLVELQKRLYYCQMYAKPSSTDDDKAKRPGVHLGRSPGASTGKPPAGSRSGGGGGVVPVCLCDGLENDQMVACDSCEKWFHYECVGLTAKAADRLDSFFCPSCGGGGEVRKKPRNGDVLGNDGGTLGAFAPVETMNRPTVPAIGNAPSGPFSTRLASLEERLGRLEETALAQLTHTRQLIMQLEQVTVESTEREQQSDQRLMSDVLLAVTQTQAVFQGRILEGVRKVLRGEEVVVDGMPEVKESEER